MSSSATKAGIRVQLKVINQAFVQMINRHADMKTVRGKDIQKDKDR